MPVPSSYPVALEVKVNRVRWERGEFKLFHSDREDGSVCQKSTRIEWGEPVDEGKSFDYLLKDLKLASKLSSPFGKKFW